MRAGGVAVHGEDVAVLAPSVPACFIRLRPQTVRQVELRSSFGQLLHFISCDRPAVLREDEASSGHLLEPLMTSEVEARPGHTSVVSPLDSSIQTVPLHPSHIPLLLSSAFVTLPSSRQKVQVQPEVAPSPPGLPSLIWLKQSFLPVPESFGVM